MFSSVLAVSLIVGASVVAQSSPSVVCVAGQCLEGLSNITIGSTLSAPGGLTSLLLLPGQYSSSSNPQLLHDVLTSSSASLSPSPGFSNVSTASSVSLPLNIALQPGLATYAQSFFSGQPAFISLSSSNNSNSSTPLSAGSLAISSNTWAAVTSGSSTSRLILWDTIPDMSQLPTSSSSSGSLSLADVQSAACSPPCAGAGTCSPSGTCTCPAGFSGSSCEACETGFFGPTCQACPAGCTSCDDGIGGSGRCLSQEVTNPPSSCNCLNGVCGSNGQCSCNAGWTASSNGTQCAQCAPGFFLTSDGDCKVCALGCTQCADQSGDCITCKSGFTQSATDATQCNPPQSVTSSGTVCPSQGSFSNGTDCAVCSPACQTCTAGTSNDCIICGDSKYSLNGTCVPTDANGVCSGSTMIADNNKHECDTCPAKCTSCGIPSFNVASTVNQLQCTGCLPGFVLSQGQCVDNCSSGTFLSPKDNLTCTACDSTCGECVGSSTFCLTCTNNQLASQGKCASTCPSNTFTSSGSCISCHPDCATCSGGAFNQCSSCSPSLPVLTSGRCLPTCSQSQFFDTTSSSCQACDASCASCSASGPSSCLACSGTNMVLRAGACVPANCANSTSVVPGLGVCLSDLVAVPQASGTASASPLPSISGLTNPTVVSTSSPRRALAWWQILLMALGCAFLVLVLLVCWRRRARKLRAKQTAAFASTKRLDRRDWKYRLLRFGERLFGGAASRRLAPEEAEAARAERMRDVEEARHARDMDKLLDAYEYPRPGTDTLHTPAVRGHFRDSREGSERSSNRLSGVSLYSQVTGMPRKGPEPRQPVKGAPQLGSRFSSTTIGTSAYSTLAAPKPPTPAEEYAMSVIDASSAKGSYWLEPQHTGASRNPFRRP